MRRSSLELAAMPVAVSAARHWTAKLLAQADTPPDQNLVDTVVLLVSEMVTNAIHAVSELGLPPNAVPAGPTVPKVWLAISRSPELVRIEVHDSACVPVLPRAPVCRRHPEEESGRGLEVISALANDWGWHPDSLGKIVWCELSATGAGCLPR
jgi:hypothetical protein